MTPGLPIFTKTEILYIEIGWELLSVRRNRRKLQLFFIIWLIKIPLIILVHWFHPPYKVHQCIHWEMGMILFYLSVDCPQLEILVSPPQ